MVDISGTDAQVAMSSAVLRPNRPDPGFLVVHDLFLDRQPGKVHLIASAIGMAQDHGAIVARALPSGAPCPIQRSDSSSGSHWHHQISLPPGTPAAEIHCGGDRVCLWVEPNGSTDFAGRSVLVAVARDGAVAEIAGSVERGIDAHGSDALLLYHDRSDGDLEELAAAVGKIAALKVLRFVRWHLHADREQGVPTPGPEGWSALRAHADLRFLGEARAVAMQGGDQAVAGDGEPMQDPFAEERLALARRQLDLAWRHRDALLSELDRLRDDAAPVRTSKTDEARRGRLRAAAFAAPVVAPARAPREPVAPLDGLPDDVADLLLALRVFRADSPKIRLGSPHDGGYVIPSSFLECCASLVSVGIGRDSRFEEDWFDLTGKPVAMWDGSCDCPGICRDRPHGPGTPITYTRRHIGPDPDQARLGDALLGRPGVLLKMDAEGAEYRSIPETDLSDCNGVVLEVHDLHRAEARRALTAMLRQLGRHFLLVHLHANNAGPAGETFPVAFGGVGFTLPRLLELTLAHRRVHRAPLEVDAGSFPVPGLDAPNKQHRPDHRLDWVNRA